MARNIASTAVIHPGVRFEGDVAIEDWCVIGALPAETDEPRPETVIGDGAVIRSHTIIYAGTSIGKNFHSGNKANIREYNIIGDDVSIGTHAVVEHHVTMGNGVRLHSLAFVPEYCVLEDGAWVGPNAVLTNSRYPLSPEAKTTPMPVRLGKGAIVGANATILPGVTIGANSLVGAGSVVTKDVADDAVVAGNPAKYLRSKDDLPYE